MNTIDRQMLEEAAELLGNTPPFQPGTVALEQWTQKVGAWMERALALRMLTVEQVTRRVPVGQGSDTGIAIWPGATNTIPEQRLREDPRRTDDPRRAGTERWRPIDPAGNVSPDPAPETPDDPDEGETGPPEARL